MLALCEPNEVKPTKSKGGKVETYYFTVKGLRLPGAPYVYHRELHLTSLKRNTYASKCVITSSVCERFMFLNVIKRSFIQLETHAPEPFRIRVLHS